MYNDIIHIVEYQFKGLLQNEIRIVETPRNTKTNTVNIKPLNGYDAIR